MCQYCEDRYPLDSDFMLFEIVNWQGKQPAILVQYSAPDTYSSVDNLVVKINFCPMCGRSLTKRAADLVTPPANEVDEITLAIRALGTAISPPNR
jgi:hypothetical protein